MSIYLYNVVKDRDLCLSTKIVERNTYSTLFNQNKLVIQNYKLSTYQDFFFALC